MGQRKPQRFIILEFAFEKPVADGMMMTISEFLRARWSYEASLLSQVLDDAHSIKGIIDLLNVSPSFVNEYSTRGGISANASLLIKPSLFSSFSLSAKLLGLMPPSLSLISL